MVNKVVQYLCLCLWQLCWDTLYKSLNNISSFIKQDRYDVTFEPGDPYESSTTLLNNVKLAGAVLAASNVLALSYISIEMDIMNGSNSHIHRFVSAKPSCLRQYLLKFCSCCKASVTECVQSLAIRMSNGSRSLAAQVCFLRPEPSTVNVF